LSGANYGGGGAGGCTAQNGGAGAQGIVVVTWTPASGPTVIGFDQPGIYITKKIKTVAY
jgi:hypothetical protein